MGNKSFEAQIKKRAAKVEKLTAKRDKLRRKFESEQTQIARLNALDAEEESLEREIAELEGKKRDDDDYGG